MATESSSKQSKLSISLMELNEANIEDLQLLNCVVLPINYSSKVYKDILKNGFGFLAVNDETNKVIGGCSGMIKINKESNCKYMYILSLGVYVGFRRNTIGTMLINEMIEKYCYKNDVNDVLLHCQSSNREAISFYESNGFKIVSKIDGFYRKLETPTAVEMKKTVIWYCYL